MGGLDGAWRYVSFKLFTHTPRASSKAITVRCSDVFSLSTAAGLTHLLAVVDQGFAWAERANPLLVKLAEEYFLFERDYWFQVFLNRAFLDRYNATTLTSENENVLRAVPAKIESNVLAIKDLKQKKDCYRDCQFRLAAVRNHLDTVQKTAKSMLKDVRDPKGGVMWANDERGARKVVAVMNIINPEWKKLQLQRDRVRQKINEELGKTLLPFDTDVFLQGGLANVSTSTEGRGADYEESELEQQSDGDTSQGLEGDVDDGKSLAEVMKEVWLDEKRAKM